MKTYTQAELKSIRTVFGEDVTFDPNRLASRAGGMGPVQPQIGPHQHQVYRPSPNN